MAVNTTIERGFGHNHCLCHGDLGNHDLILTASEVLGDTELRARADLLAAGILTSIEQGGWRCGAHAHNEWPGLMVGLAGIGYGLLRAMAPERVPSVLIFQTPRDR